MSHFLLANAVLASIVAVLVFFSSRVIRSASVVHLLWLVVLLRFLVPPLVALPIYASLNESARLDNPRPILSQGGSPAASNIVGLPVVKRGQESGIQSSDVLVTVWAAGAVFVLASAITRAIRFQDLVQRTGVDDEGLQEQLRKLGDEMSVRSIPKTRLVRARISPMVWAWFRRPVLFLPMELWSTLPEDERAAILRHELAHLARRDHWVRAVEALATVTHWWCPVLWWARRELHRLEERCCDTWASSSGPESRAALARACLRTVDFIGQKAPQVPQFGATRMVKFHTLRERLQFILEGENMQTTTPRFNIATILVLVIVLGLSPRLGAARGPSSQAANAVSVPHTFDGVRVIGAIDVAIEFGKSQMVTFDKTMGRQPHFEVDDRKRLVISFASKPRPAHEKKRPRVVVTTPSLATLEALNSADVSVRNVTGENLLMVVTDGARIAADGHCDSLTVNADNSGTLSAKKLTAGAATISATESSVIALGKVQSLIESIDASSTVDVTGEGVGLVRIRQVRSPEIGN